MYTVVEGIKFALLILMSVTRHGCIHGNYSNAELFWLNAQFAGTAETWCYFTFAVHELGLAHFTGTA